MTPTVGRVVHYFPNLPATVAEPRPFAAIVATAQGGEDEFLVNLSVVGSSGEQFGRTGVLFVESADDAPEVGRPYCTWPARVAETAEPAAAKAPAAKKQRPG